MEPSMRIMVEHIFGLQKTSFRRPAHLARREHTPG
jgi:hypothetical protein